MTRTGAQCRTWQRGTLREGIFFETNDKRTRCSDRMAASSQTSVPDARQRAKLGQKNEI